MAFSMDEFISNFKGGARQYLFYFLPNWPSVYSGMSSEKSVYLVRSTTLPEATFENITAGWQGWEYKVPGRKTFADWTVSFNVDVNADIIKDYHTWHDKIRKTEDGTSSLPSEFMADQTLQLLDGEGKVIMDYTIKHAYPLTISAPSLDYQSNDIVQFDVTFSFLYYTIKGVNE